MALFVPTIAFTQLATANILGMVTDATGAAIPNAKITITNIDTHEPRSTTSNGSVEYQAALLPVGHYSAEAGPTKGGVVSIITRSGSRGRGRTSFTGSAYEFFRNDIFGARNVLQGTGRKPELRQNQFGGSLGGPIFKDVGAELSCAG